MKAGSLPLEAGSWTPDTRINNQKKYKNYEQRKKVFNP